MLWLSFRGAYYKTLLLLLFILAYIVLTWCITPNKVVFDQITTKKTWCQVVLQQHRKTGCFSVSGHVIKLPCVACCVD